MPRRGTTIFLTVWVGQLVSLLGSTLTSFALGVWVYQRTGDATEYALISFFVTVPGIVMAPLAGVLADRWDRRRVMMLSDSGAACGTLLMAVLLLAGNLDLWHIYLATTISATFSAFQYPAYMASITLLVPKQHYARASGLVDLAGALGYILAPALGAFLLNAIQLRGVLLLDVSTFLFALLTLSVVRFPRPATTAEGYHSRGVWYREALFGWSYIRARRGLRALLLLFATANFFNGIVTVLMVPLILSFSSSAVLGAVGSISATGFLAGGAVMAAWGGPKRAINGILIFGAVSGLATALAGLRESAVLITAGLWVLFFCGVIIDACSQSIWQRKVAPDVQGRVFAVRAMIVQLALPLAYLIAGPLADEVFEPLFGRAGRGIGALFVVMGLLIAAAVIGGWLYSPLRRIEEELPDHSAEPIKIS